MNKLNKKKTGKIFSTTFICVFAVMQSFSQLTIYSDANQLGLSGSCVTSTIYTGNSIPQSLNNQFSSINLLQGYMATIAENEDGTGAAYTFVAAVSNVTVNLSSLLNDKASFIRVLPIRNTLKKGLGNTNNTWIDLLNVSWFYDWGALDVSTVNREYSIMAWGRNATNVSSVNNFIAKTDISHLLSFNEPDNAGQANINYGEAVPLHNNLAGTGYRLGSPATTEGQATVWLTSFMDSAARANVKVDYIAVHWYDWASYSGSLNTAPDPNAVFTRFKNYINNIYAIYRKPIWITEFNANPNTTAATHSSFITLALPWLEAQPFVERYAYFFPAALPPVDGAGNMTAMGNAYKNFVSTNYALNRNWDNTEHIAAGNNAIYEAESATLIGSNVTNCANASNGQMASAVTGTTNKIIFHTVTVNTPGNYTLDISYYANTARNITVQINGNLPQIISIPASGLYCYQGASPGTYAVSIQLKAGQNKITFTEAPIIDKIGVNFLSVLPVNLLEFYSIVKQKAIELKWKTTQEINNNHFELFKSKDGIQFELMAKVAGNNNSNTENNYSFLDVAPVTGINYYRLNHVDNNGNSKAYKTINARYGGKGESLSMISWQNQKLLLGINNSLGGAGTIYVNSSNGKILLQQNVVLQSGQTQINIPTSNITKGIYFITLKTLNGNATIKALL